MKLLYCNFLFFINNFKFINNSSTTFQKQRNQKPVIIDLSTKSISVLFLAVSSCDIVNCHCVVCFFWVVFSLCIVCILNLSSVQYEPA